MSVTLSKQGGDLKIEFDSVVKYFSLLDLEISISSDFVYFQDGSFIDFNDVTSPSVSSAEDLADQIGAFIYQLTTGA
jgi:hypothetical protein